MQQIINALIKNKVFILFLALLLFSFKFISNRSFYHHSKFDKIAIGLTGGIFNIKHSVNEYFNLKKINNELLIENKKLLKREINKNENKLFNKSNIPFDVFQAKVIKNSIKSSRNYLIVNKGAKDSITREMGVISSKGIIGIIYKVSENYSSVISILNRDLQINAKFKKNNAFGSLNWNGINTNKVKLSDIPVINDVKIGDSIVTGGMSTYFPDGILIGVVSDYEIDLGRGYYEIDVELNNIIGNEINVFILKNKYQAKIKSLE